MLIKKVKITNYKTYLSLDLDLTVEEDRPIILIGGMNGGGKTTLFEAICGALYGLKIRDKAHFNELLNAGALGIAKPEIILEVTFTGLVLGREQKYILRRTYALNPQDKPVESVMLNMNGTPFIYGTATPPQQRRQSEQQVNKIIKANLPQELSQYFLFDAMQSSELLKDGVFAQIIKDNIENVMGFNKYLQLKKAAEKLQQAKAKERLDAEAEREEYEQLCSEKDSIEKEIVQYETELDGIFRYLQSMEQEYENAKSGARDFTATRLKIDEIEAKMRDARALADSYSEELKQMVDGIEGNIFLPKLAADLSTEINNIIRIKEGLRQAGQQNYSPEKVREIASKILKVLREMQMVSADVDEEKIVSIIMAQSQPGKADPYAFLEDKDVDALVNLINNPGINPFIRVNEDRQLCEVKIEQLPELQLQKESLERGLVGGNEQVIADYEQAECRQNEIKEKIVELKARIKTLEKRIHNFDIQLQQEPDVKFDTLVKLTPFFDNVANALLERKRLQIETEMQQQLNKLLISYKGHIDRVELSDNLENFYIKVFHTKGNEISLNQLNAASKQIFIQVLLKVLRNLGDYNPPVMIDTVMGVLDNESRDALMQEYFPQLAEQTILLCTTSEIRKESDYKQLEAFISRTYTLERDIENQCTYVADGYFGLHLNNE